MAIKFVRKFVLDYLIGLAAILVHYSSSSSPRSSSSPSAEIDSK